MPQPDGKLSRRSAITTGMAIFSGAVVAAASVRAEDTDEPKLSKARVHYQYTPNAEGSHCSICANFIIPSSCHIVEGVISGGGYCLVFSPTDIDLDKELP